MTVVDMQGNEVGPVTQAMRDYWTVVNPPTATFRIEDIERVYREFGQPETATEAAVRAAPRRHRFHFEDQDRVFTNWMRRDAHGEIPPPIVTHREQPDDNPAEPDELFVDFGQGFQRVRPEADGVAATILEDPPDRIPFPEEVQESLDILIGYLEDQHPPDEYDQQTKNRLECMRRLGRRRPR